MGEIVLLAFGSALWPLLIAITVIALQAPNPKPAAKGGSSWAEGALGHGAPLAFVSGILLNVVPGFLPLVALKDIAELDVGTVSVVLIVTGFYIVMFAFVEIPLVGYLFAPERTTRLTARFNLWLSANGRRVGAWIAAACRCRI